MREHPFRLHALLRIRQLARDQRRVELAEMQRAVARLEDQQARLEAMQAQARRDCRAAIEPGDVDLARWIEAQRFAAALRIDAAEVQRRRETLQTELQRRRLAAIDADRNVKTLEKLRENQRDANRQKEQKQANHQLDDYRLPSSKARERTTFDDALEHENFAN